MVSIRISKRLRKSPFRPQKQVSLVKKTKNKKSLTPTMKQISVKNAKKSITVEDSPGSIDCLLTTPPENSKTPFIPEKIFKNTKTSASTPIKQTSGMSSPRRTRRSIRNSREKTIEGIQKVLNIPGSQKRASKDHPDPIDTFPRIPSSTPMKKTPDKTSSRSTRYLLNKSLASTPANETARFSLRRSTRLSQKQINEDCIHVKKTKTSDQTSSRRTKSLPIKLLATSTNETVKFSPRRTRSQKKLINEDTHLPKKQISDSSPHSTRKSLSILQQKTSSTETLCVTPTYESSKGTPLTCSEKQILLPGKRARTSQKLKSNKRARESSTPKEPAKNKQAKTGHQRKSSVNLQKQASRTKNSSASIKRTVAKYKKDLESIPIDNLSYRYKAKSTGDCKRSKRAILKLKRATISEIKKADEGYEDDIYEFKEFENFDVLPDTPGSVFSASGIETPVWGFQAKSLIYGKKTPKFKDCFSPTDLSLKRKVAQDYIYRIKNRKRSSTAKTPVLPEKKRLEFDEAIAESLKLQEANKKLAEDDDDEDENDDDYFSDL